MSFLITFWGKNILCIMAQGGGLFGNYGMRQVGGAIFSELDQEHEKNIGGVLMSTKGHAAVVMPKVKSEESNNIIGEGRVLLYACEVGKGITVLVYNVYGWTGGAQD